jgi:hypothetical protein
MSENAFSLIVCLPDEAPARHDLSGDLVAFGRSPENDLQVLVSEVSVRHGRFEREGDSYRLVDPGSTNGTRVNGAPVGPEGVLLQAMDSIVLGTVVPVHFVPTAILETTPLAEVVSSLSATRAAEAKPGTAAVAVAAPGAGTTGAPRAAIPVSAPGVAPSGGGATVKLDQVRPGGGAVRPAAPPSSPKLPLAAPRPAPGAPPQAPGVAPVKAPAAAPSAPGVGGRPPGVAPVKPPSAAPAAPGAAPRAPGVAPVKPPAAAPSTGGAAPRPVPLKRPEPGAPTIPLPKLPPKPGQ